MSATPQMVAACGSCGTPIYWLKNEQTGKPAPIDAEPSEKGNISIDLSRRTYRTLNRETANALRATSWLDGIPYPLHLNHFVTCPQAKTWSKAGRA